MIVEKYTVIGNKLMTPGSSCKLDQRYTLDDAKQVAQDMVKDSLGDYAPDEYEWIEHPLGYSYVLLHLDIIVVFESYTKEIFYGIHKSIEELLTDRKEYYATPRAKQLACRFCS